MLACGQLDAAMLREDDGLPSPCPAATSALGASGGTNAGVFHIINRAVFKASPLMAAGVIDQECGTRDMRRVNGMGGKDRWKKGHTAYGTIDPPAQRASGNRSAVVERPTTALRLVQHTNTGGRPKQKPVLLEHRLSTFYSATYSSGLREGIARGRNYLDDQEIRICGDERRRCRAGQGQRAASRRAQGSGFPPYRCIQ